ncbi:MAG TPA: YciI family protein [Candidatus Limnocylindrales bacterium]|nr:YciI family protein [Candidatus Limnocylindrales bacterium]
MRYMLLIYTREDAMAQRSPEETQKTMEAHWELMDDTRRKGILEGVEPLARTGMATTVRVQNGKPIVTDGPFAETREQLAGYYILNCKDLDETIAYARRIPTCCGGAEGCIEIRPLPGLPQREPLPHQETELSVAHNG